MLDAIRSPRTGNRVGKFASLRSIWTMALVVAIGAWTDTPARAGMLTADGITYSLDETPLTSTQAQFTLDITGINAASDTEGGRYGVNSIAFTESPPGSVLSGSLSAFAFMTGGLNAMGCDGSGNFFCFKANIKPSAPVLPANSSLQFTFDLTFATAAELNNFDPSFKIEWIGTKSSGNKSGYDLVSQPLTPSVVPLPATLPLLLSGIAGLGWMRRRRTV